MSSVRGSSAARSTASSPGCSVQRFVQGDGGVDQREVGTPAGRGDGHPDEVMRSLEEAYKARASALIIQLNSPFLDFVREDPRFHALLRRMGLDHLVDYRPTREFRPAVTR